MAGPFLIACSVLLTVAFATGMTARLSSGGRITLTYAPAPADNPLKGLVPYVGAGTRPDGTAKFPHSLEFTYFPLSDFVVGPDRYDFSVLEKTLDDVVSRGNRLVFRVYLDYPNGEPGLPAYLRAAGVTVHRDTREQYPNLYADVVESTEYDDPRVVRCLVRFVETLGERYDGDPRVGFITAGLLGYWGEWHNYPANGRWASKSTQIAVMDAYERAFRRTPILLRYPAGPDHGTHAANTARPFGYHDDSFAWSTIDTGRDGDRWNFRPQLVEQGVADRWKTLPIGGEIRPELWGRLFDTPPHPRAQDFGDCVEQTRVTWLMDSGMFPTGRDARPSPPDRVERAIAHVRRMGYELHVTSARVNFLPGRRLRVRVDIENCGVAPFCHDWPCEYGLINDAGDVVLTAASRHGVRGILPGEPLTWDDTIPLRSLPPGTYTLALRAIDPLEAVSSSIPVRPLRFANVTQDAHAPGWLSLTPVTVR